MSYRVILAILIASFPGVLFAANDWCIDPDRPPCSGAAGSCTRNTIADHNGSYNGGFVADTASVEYNSFFGLFRRNIAFIGRSAQVCDQASVFGQARVFGHAQVLASARVSGRAWVYNNAHVFGNAQIFGDAQVFGNARVDGSAQVYGRAWVYDSSHVYGNARIYGGARVFGSAQLSNFYQMDRGEVSVGPQSRNVLLEPEGQRGEVSHRAVDPVLSLSDRTVHIEPQDVCPICIEQFNESHGRIEVTPCGHAFHKKCLMKWLLEKSHCPACRKGIPSEDA
jgi:hypothetical protein